VVINGCLRSQTRTFTATDACNNSATISRMVTWTADTTKPVFTGGYASVPLGCNPTEAAILAALDGATATDNCGTATITQADAAVVINGCLRSQTRTFTATDACNNSATISRMVTWTADTTKPVFTGSYVTVPLGCNPTAAAILAALDGATATDNCGTANITQADAAVVINGCLRSQTRTFTATDACNNSATISRMVTWTADTTKPVFTFCPPGSNLGCNPTSIPAAGAATATDACGAPTITSALGAITSNGCLRSQTRTYTATDSCGNNATCRQVFTWRVDVAPPTITCGANKTSDCNGVPVFDTPTATDGCGGVDIGVGVLTISGNTYTTTWTATDACGNTASCSQTITKICYGCSQGFWKNHSELWDQGTDYTVDRMPGSLPSTPGGTFITTTNFWTYFGITFAPGNGISDIPTLTMLQANGLIGGNCKNLARQGVAALLGKAAFGNNYAYNGSYTTLYQAIRTALMSGNCSSLATTLDISNNNEVNGVCSGLKDLSQPISPVITGLPQVTEPQLKVSAFPNPYTEQNFSLKINAPLTGKATIEFFTIDGNKISEMTRTITANIDETVNFKVPSLTKLTVVYLIRIGKYTTRGMVLNPNN
jgi:hypothetical protein